MNRYIETKVELWSGRKSDQGLYVHEKVQCINIERESIPSTSAKRFALLGYACDEGVKRNQGRKGSRKGPKAIRKALAKLPNHLEENVELFDVGNLECIDGKLENIQAHLAEKVALLLRQKTFPILLGGGHDIAYGHFIGSKNHLGPDKAIGIINFDAHFDLRNNANGSNSGTPFYQIAEDCKKEGTDFHYLALGIRKDANDSVLFRTANELGVRYIENKEFVQSNAKYVVQTVLDFLADVDYVYVTIDLDGFSSAYAPGVSAASPIGFSPHIVLETLEMIIKSGKLSSIDIVELNPKYDIDARTAKLAASLVHFVIHNR